MNVKICPGLKDEIMDRRHMNSVGRNGYGLNDQEIIKLYIQENWTLNQLAEKYNVSWITILDHLKKNNIRKNARHRIDKQTFSMPNTDNCYWAGFIAADGSVGKSLYSVSIELSDKDVNHLLKLANFVKDKNPNLYYRIRQNTGLGEQYIKVKKYASFTIYSKDVVKDITNNFNIIPNKSLVLQPPNINDEGLIKNYIRGYFDGDGSIGWHKYNNIIRLSFCSGSEILLQWIGSEINKQLNINTIIHKSKNNQVFALDKMGYDALEICKWLYLDSTEQIRLDRKYDRFIKYQELMQHRRDS